LKHLGKENLIDLCDFMGGYVNTAILLHTVNVHLPYDREPLLPVPGAPAGSLPRAKTLAEYNASLPKDVYPDSRSRIPLIKREDLEEDRRGGYDERVSPSSTSLAGLQGPGGLGLNGSRNLSETGVDRRLQELARLVVSREMDQVFEWGMHEPVALKEGLEPEIIDVIRYRKPLTGVPAKEASVIQLGREIFQNHKVSSETFANVLKHLGKRNLVDLCRFMGNYATTAILLHTVDLHLPYDREPRLPLS
jgi:4-carboxymuconolactone decarboxylase